MGECAGKDLHKRLQNKLAAKAIFGDKLIIFLHFPGFKTSCVNLATVAFPPLEILREERLKRWLLEREKFFIRKDKSISHPVREKYFLPGMRKVFLPPKPKIFLTQKRKVFLNLTRKDSGSEKEMTPPCCIR